jgi:hypothetical protein
VSSEGGIVSANGILAGADLRAHTHLEAGWGIKAWGDIEAGGAIRAGDGVEAGGVIVAGPGYGIHAGLNVRMDDWPASACIRAAQQPSRLISGYWAEAA